MEQIQPYLPLVSVVMSAHNEDKYISEAIESIINQTYSNLEFIIINDGSTDGTERIIQSYNDSRIIYVKNERNLGLIGSLNKGLSIAKGKYIARMDSDDISTLNRLALQVQFMENNPSVGISGAQLKIFGAEQGKMCYPLTHEEIKLRLFITSVFGNNVVCFRRELMTEYQLNFPEGYLHAEDYKCWSMWISKTTGANLDLELVNYRSHPNSVSNKNKEKQRETRNRIRLEYVVSNFNVSNELAGDFVGPISLSRVRATKLLLKQNNEKKMFDVKKLEQTFLELWYLDSLEQVENNFKVFFLYPLIFIVDIRGNFKRWIFVLKHRIKFRR